MKTSLVVSMAVATVIASSSFASAATIHRPAADAYAAANGQYYGQQNYGPQYQQPQAAVTFGNRVVGQDPDQNIRAQLERDPVPTEY